MVGRLVSFWNGLFSGAMFVFRECIHQVGVFFFLSVFFLPEVPRPVAFLLLTVARGLKENWDAGGWAVQDQKLTSMSHVCVNGAPILVSLL